MRIFESVGIVITTFRPNQETVSTIQALLDNGFKVIVGDNTENGSCLLHQLCTIRPDMFVHFNNANLGLGAALNAGLLIAQDLRLNYVMLLDQDTCPSCELVLALLAAHDKASMLCRGSAVVVAPKFGKSSVVTGDYSYDDIELKRVNCLPTAGMLFKLQDIRGDTLFSEDIFLDLCDFEWCWRLAKKGWFFYSALNYTIDQQLGEGQQTFLSISINVPAPFRHYFQFRDTLRLALRGYVPFKSKFRLLGVLPLKLFIYPFVLDRGLMRLKWMLFGIVDALLGRSGKGKANDII